MPDNNQMMSVQGQLVGMPLAGPESFSQQQLEYLKRALGVDETVLWTGTPSTSNITLSESAANFEYIRVFGKWHYNNTEDSGRGIEVTTEELVPTSEVSFTLSGFGVETLISPARVYLTSVDYRIDGTTLIRRQGLRIRNDSQAASTSDTIEAYKVIGIHRIAGGNQ